MAVAGSGFHLTLADVRYLQDPEAARWLDALAAEGLTTANHLGWAERLRDAVGRERAAALLETALLRERAAAKFTRARRMLFEREALEQATPEPVARYRASVFASAGIAGVLELGCGIGGDSLALTGVAGVVAVERDPVRLALAEHNVAVYDGAAAFTGLEGDALSLEPSDLPDWGGSPSSGLFFDPGRRDEQGRRLSGLQAYRPPVGPVLARWLPAFPNAAVKASPALDFAEVPADADVEIVSLDGGVREAILWFGALRRGAARRATLLPGGETITSHAMPTSVGVSSPLAVLYEPDGAVIRAGLVAALAGQLDARQIDTQIAYLTARESRPTPFARTFAVEDSFPFQLKRLRAYLRDRGIGRVTIKKRGSAVDVAELESRLRLRGALERTVFLTRVKGEPWVLVALPATD